MNIKKADENEIRESVKIAKELGDWFSKEGLKNIIKDIKEHTTIVILNKGEVLGFLTYTKPYCGKIVLIWMGIKKNRQRRGLGKKLLDYVEKEAREKGVRILEIETLPDEDDYEPYKKTRAFWYKNGFVRTAYKKAIIKGWDDQIIMEKLLK